LPSPSRESQDPNHHSTTVLKAGKILTRIYDFDDFFPYWDRSESVQLSRETGRRSFALDYAILIPTQSLRLGYHTFLNITPPAVLPFISAPLIARATTGDQDGACPPWFSYADATLLSSQADIYGQDIASLSLRAWWTESGRLEIWPDSQHWGNDSLNTPNLSLSPLLSIENYTPGTQARFRAILPTKVSSSSPSYTYPIRVMILKVLKPTALALLEFLGVLNGIFTALWSFIGLVAKGLIIYMAAVALLWLIKGKPPFQEFFATSLITRPIAARFGIKSEQQLSTAVSIEKDDRKKDPKPLTNIWAFFKSTSPLDDLFVTFAFTRRLTQPLRQRSSSASDQTEEKAGNDPGAKV